jgi:hypothetical protein
MRVTRSAHRGSGRRNRVHCRTPNLLLQRAAAAVSSGSGEKYSLSGCGVSACHRVLIELQKVHE